MGKAAKLVTIIVTEEEMLTWPVFAKMLAQGHQVLALSSLLPTLLSQESKPPFALVMGPRAHLLRKGMDAMVAVALKQARVELYDTQPKEA